MKSVPCKMFSSFVSNDATAKQNSIEWLHSEISALPSEILLQKLHQEPFISMNLRVCLFFTLNHINGIGSSCNQYTSTVWQTRQVYVLSFSVPSIFLFLWSTKSKAATQKPILIHWFLLDKLFRLNWCAFKTPSGLVGLGFFPSPSLSAWMFLFHFIFMALAITSSDAWWLCVKKGESKFALSHFAHLPSLHVHLCISNPMNPLNKNK